jgi:hypothetical protein
LVGSRCRWTRWFPGLAVFCCRGCRWFLSGAVWPPCGPRRSASNASERTDHDYIQAVASVMTTDHPSIVLETFWSDEPHADLSPRRRRVGPGSGVARGTRVPPMRDLAESGLSVKSSGPVRMRAPPSALRISERSSPGGGRPRYDCGSQRENIRRSGRSPAAARAPQMNRSDITGPSRVRSFKLIS